MEFARECFEVLRPLCEHEAISLNLDGSSDVTADLPRAFIVFDEAPEYGLNTQLLVNGLLMAGGVCVTSTRSTRRFSSWSGVIRYRSAPQYIVMSFSR